MSAVIQHTRLGCPHLLHARRDKQPILREDLSTDHRPCISCPRSLSLDINQFIGSEPVVGMEVYGMIQCGAHFVLLRHRRAGVVIDAWQSEWDIGQLHRCIHNVKIREVDNAENVHFAA